MLKQKRFIEFFPSMLIIQIMTDSEQILSIEMISKVDLQLQKENY